MNSMTRTRKTTTPRRARSLTSLPQLAPIWSWEISSPVTPTVSVIDGDRPRRSPRAVSSSVWTMIGLSPAVVHGRATGVLDAEAADRLAHLVGVVLGGLARGELADGVLRAAGELDAVVEPLHRQAEDREQHDDGRRRRTRATCARRSRSTSCRCRGRCRVGRTCPSGVAPRRRRAVDGWRCHLWSVGDLSMPSVSALSPESRPPPLKNVEPRQHRDHRLGEPEEHHEVDRGWTGPARTRSPGPRRSRRCRARSRRAARPPRRPDRWPGPASSRPRPRPASTCRRASRP